jgi:hypothetical protein
VASIQPVCDAIASTGTPLRLASNRPLIRCKLPGPQLAAHWPWLLRPGSDRACGLGHALAGSYVSIGGRYWPESPAVVSAERDTYHGRPG